MGEPQGYRHGHHIELTGHPQWGWIGVELHNTIHCTCGNGDNPYHTTSFANSWWNKTKANTWDWGRDIATILIDALVEGGRYVLVHPDCHQITNKKRGESFMVQCADCGEWKDVTGLVYADLQGEAYKSYHCIRCRLEQIGAADIFGEEIGVTGYQEHIHRNP